MCIFCKEFNEGSARIIWEDDDWIVIPGLGAFVAGYCLLLPRDCYRSFSCLPAEILTKADRVAETVRRTISLRFGPVTIAEHGVAKNFSYTGSACCNDHAHLHFLPVPDPLLMERSYGCIGGTPTQIKTLSGLASVERAYLFLSTIAQRKQYWLWQPSFTKQFARRVAASLNHETRWDWRADYFEDNMRKTIEELKPFPVPWKKAAL